MSDRDPVTGEHTPMDAGAWRREALGLRARVRELELALLEERYGFADALDAHDDRLAHARFMAAGWRRLAELAEEERSGAAFNDD